ncbi:MAG: PHP domain-containing protein, partial [Bacteroidota bacterium]
MSWTNFHSHSHFCDGKGSPEEQVKSAIEKGMASFGFSSHCPVPFETSWAMKASALPEYLRETRRLQTSYADQIELYVGLEVDYIPSIIGPSAE